MKPNRASHRSESGGTAVLPVSFKPVVEVSAAQRQDGVGAADSPEHAGLLEARADDGFAAGLDNAGTNEQMLAAELGVAHTLGVFLEVVGFVVKLLGGLRMGREKR